MRQMSARQPQPRGTLLEQTAWLTLVLCVFIVPLSVGVLPGMPRPLTYTVFGYPQSVMLTAGVAVALTLWGVALWRRETSIIAPKAAIFAAWFTAWAAVATITGYEPMRSLLGKSTSSLSFVNVLTYMVVFFLVIQLTASRARLRTLTWSVLLSGTAVALLGLFQQLLNTDLLGLPAVDLWLASRGFSTLGNPDHLGTFLVLPAALAGTLTLVEENTSRRAAALACFAVQLTTLVGTLTRGAWVAILTGLLTVCVLTWPLRHTLAKRTAVLLVVAVACVAVALLASDPADLPTRFATVTQASPSDSPLEALNAVLSDRVNVWGAALRITAERPLVGTGPAAFELGWYPHAINPTSGGGTGAIADDPHSLVVYVLATMGVPGLIGYLCLAVSAIACGARIARTLIGTPQLTAEAGHYLAWLVGAVAVQVALLVAAVDVPILMYTLVSFAVLLRPSARAVVVGSPVLAFRVWPVASSVTALVLVMSLSPSLVAETALPRALTQGDLERAQKAAQSVPWNLDVQQAYFHMRTMRVDAALTARNPAARDGVQTLADELAQAANRQPRELYYRAAQVQVLTRASEILRDPAFAEAAIEAADKALAIMPASIPVRVNKALALSDLGRWEEMVAALQDYWQNELSSPYPGIVYAQALALSGNRAEAERVFDALSERFPEDPSINEARTQTERLLDGR